MKIIVRPTNWTAFNSYINKGSDAFLFSINGLSISSNPITITGLRSAKQLLNGNALLFVSLDKNMFNSDLNLLEKTLIKLEKIGVDGVLFYDVAVLNIVKRLNLNINLIWNQNFLVTNYESIKYYQQKGVDKALISNEITMDEIKEISDNTDIELMVNIFGYQMMSFSKRKLIGNYFKYFKKTMLKNIYLIEDDKGNKSPIVENKEGTMIFNHNILNGILEINNLKDKKIDYVILDENLIKHNIFMQILEIYSDAINNKLDDAWLRTKKLETLKLLDNMDDGFFNKKTIFKVK